MQGGEGGLPVLVLREVVIALQALEPSTNFDLMAAEGPVDVIVDGKEIARNGVVAADIAARAGDLRCAVGGSGAGDDDGADGTTSDEAGDIDRGAAEEIEGCAGEAETCCVEQPR